MNTKKAIVLGTLGAILIGLVSFFASKYIKSTNRITTTYADNINAKKNRITTDALNNGWQYDVEPTSLEGGDQTFWTNPETYTYTYTEQPTNYENTSWVFKPTIFLNASIDLDINFQSAGTNWIAMIDDGDTMAWIEEDDPGYNNPIVVYRNDAFIDSSYRYITITENTTSTTFKNWLWNNTERTTETFLGNIRHETKTSSYLGIEYVQMSQKTFSYNKIKNETLFYIKLQSTGRTTQLFLEHAVFYTAIPNMVFNNTYATYNAQFKMSKMASVNMPTGSTLYQHKTSFLDTYNNIPNKTNIYSVDAYVSGTTMNQQQNITYTNEIGTTGAATFGHTNASSINTSMWTISSTTPDIDIYTQGRANYVVIYFNCEVSNFTNEVNLELNYPNWHKYLYEYVGATTQFEGFGIGSNPITPPDIENGNFMSLTGMILNILTLPFTFLSQAFDLTLWANTPWTFNIKNAIFVMIGIFTFLFIIKLFTRGFDSLGNFTNNRADTNLKKSQTKLNKQKLKANKQQDKKE